MIKWEARAEILFIYMIFCEGFTPEILFIITSLFYNFLTFIVTALFHYKFHFYGSFHKIYSVFCFDQREMANTSVTHC